MLPGEGRRGEHRVGVKVDPVIAQHHHVDVVLPDADLKIYLTASLQERARRRYAELAERAAANSSTLPTMEEVLLDIQRRDEIDHDNMRPADDAIVIVTDNLSVLQVLEVICSYLEEPV